MQKTFVKIEDVTRNGEEIIFSAVWNGKYYFNINDAKYLINLGDEGNYKYELAPDLSGSVELYDYFQDETFSEREFYPSIVCDGVQYFAVCMSWVTIYPYEFDIEICDTLDESLSLLFEELPQGIGQSIDDLGGLAGMYYSGKDESAENTEPNLIKFLYHLCNHLNEISY